MNMHARGSHARGSHARGSHSRRAAWASSCRPGMPSLLLPSSSSLLVFVLDRDRRQRVAVAIHTPSLRPPLLASRRCRPAFAPIRPPFQGAAIPLAIPLQLIFVFLPQKQQHAQTPAPVAVSAASGYRPLTQSLFLCYSPLPSATALFTRSFRSFRSLIPHLLFPVVLFLVVNDDVVALGFQLFNLDPATAQVQPLSNLFL